MLTENEQQTPPAASQAAPAEQPATAAPMFTTEQVAEREQRAAQKAHDAAMAEARRVFQGKQKAESNQPQQPATQPANTAPAATTALDIARVVQFTTEAAQHGIPAKGIELLATRLDAERPTDVRAWVAEQADAYGWRKPTTAPTPTVAPNAAQPVTTASNATPVTGNGAPSNPTATLTDDVPLLNRSEQQRQDYLRQHGYVKFTDRLREESLRNNARLRLPR